jgi:hypothetical protein
VFVCLLFITCCSVLYVKLYISLCLVFGFYSTGIIINKSGNSNLPSPFRSTSFCLLFDQSLFTDRVFVFGFRILFNRL